MEKKQFASWLVVLAVAILNCASSISAEILPAKESDSPPSLDREFRGVWVATIANIDWPSRPGLSVEQQKSELIQILDRAVALKLNAIVLQVRSQCDALYASAIEPWSSSLSGRMGQAPQPFYDPLEFAVAESHKRSLELHAWLNPFRALKKSKWSPPSANHVSKLHLEFVRDYGTHFWLDPGEPAARDYSLSVVLDILKRYDIDGLHFDDYFYPYSERDAENKIIPFPDDASFKTYTNGGGKLSRSDWRRENVNEFIQTVNKVIKKEKPWVKFGISPFGLWRPLSGRTNKQLDAYEELACDSRKWLMEGWVDYLAPQLYWRTDSVNQPYGELLKWWAEQNPLKRHLWPGHFDSAISDVDKATGNAKMTTDDIVSQIRLTRQQAGASGDIHYSMKALMANRGEISDRLAKEVYSKPALIPASPWLNASAPDKPKIDIIFGNNETKISWQPTSSAKVWLWVLQKKTGGEWSTEIFPVEKNSLSIKSGASTTPPLEALALTALNRYGNASPTALFKMKP